MKNLFKPVVVDRKIDLTADNVPIINGQYIVVIDSNELYLDKDNIRTKVSQNIFIQADKPLTPKNGDIWFQIEE